MPERFGPKVKCPDCGATYAQGAPHYMFCEAKTCENCGTTYSETIEPDENGNRICNDCE